MSESEIRRVYKCISKKISYPEEYLTVEEMELLLKKTERMLKKRSSSNWFWLVIKYMLENAIKRAVKRIRRTKKKKRNKNVKLDE